MRILFVYQVCSLGGCETVLRNRVLGFREHGFVPRVVMLQDLGGGRLFTGFDEVTYPCGVDELTQIIDRGGFDYVAALDTPQVYPALARARFTGTLITEVHSNRIANMQYLHDLGSSSTRVLVTPSRFEAELIRREFPSVRSSGVPIHVIPNPVDTRLFRPSQPSIQPAQPWVGWVGRLEPEKNWRHFLSVAAALGRVRPDVAFMVIGGWAVSDAVKREFLSRAKELRLIDRIRWVSALGYEAMSRFYGLLGTSGGCLLATSLHEPFGMSIVEAMASGCPVAAARAGAFRELIEDGHTGLAFTPDDTTEAVARVVRLLDDAPLRARIVAGGLAMIERAYTPYRVAGSYLELLAELSGTSALAPDATLS